MVRLLFGSDSMTDKFPYRVGKCYVAIQEHVDCKAQLHISYGEDIVYNTLIYIVTNPGEDQFKNR